MAAAQQGELRAASEIYGVVSQRFKGLPLPISFLEPAPPEVSGKAPTDLP